jgi:hypothetical protein
MPEKARQMASFVVVKSWFSLRAVLVAFGRLLN